MLSKRKIIYLINELKKEMTIIFTSHNLQEVYQLCDRFVILNQGKIILDEDKAYITEKIGYVNIHLTLSHTQLNLNGLTDYQVQQVNDVEYIIHKVPKKELAQLTSLLFSHNHIDVFELQESDLETLLTTLSEEVVNNESNH